MSVNEILLQEAEETTHDKGQRTWCPFQWPFLPALAFPSASLSRSRESERAGQHHAARTLDKQKTQLQSVLWTAPSTDFPQMAKGDLLSPVRSISCSPAVPCQGQSLGWRQVAVSQCLHVTWAGSEKRWESLNAPLYNPVQKSSPCHQTQAEKYIQYLPEDRAQMSQSSSNKQQSENSVLFSTFISPQTCLSHPLTKATTLLSTKTKMIGRPIHMSHLQLLDDNAGKKHTVSAQVAKDDVVTSCFGFPLWLNWYINKIQLNAKLA